MSSQNDQSFTWKDMATAFLFPVMAGVVIGLVGRLGPVPWWHRLAVSAGLCFVGFIAVAVIVRTRTFAQVIKQAPVFGLLVGAVLLLPWWGMFLSAAAIVAVGYILHERKNARRMKQGEDSRS